MAAKTESKVAPAPRQKLTPAQLAEIWQTSTDKIGVLIRSGELRAINIAKRTSRRPRYLIDPADVEAFERSRQVVPASTGVTRVRRKTAPGVTEFF